MRGDTKVISIHKHTPPVSHPPSPVSAKNAFMMFLFFCFYLQPLSSSLVRPRSSRPEQGELCGRLAGGAEDDPVPRLLPGLGLHLAPPRHANHSRVSRPRRRRTPPHSSFRPSFLSVSPCLRLTLLTCQVCVSLVGRLAGSLFGCSAAPCVRSEQSPRLARLPPSRHPLILP